MSESPRVLRVAVIGAGYFARFHIEAWQRLARAELIALCDADPQRLAAPEIATLAPQARRYASAEQLLRERADDIDILDVATPPASHLPLFKLAAAHGIRRAVCQKPLAPTHAEAVRLVELTEAAGMTLAVHENFRFMPWHQEQHRLIAAGQFGKLHGLSMRLRPGDGQGPRAYLDRQPYFQQMQRFLIHETAIHFIDTFRYLGGEIDGVFARLRRLNPAIAGEDAGLLIFEFASGAAGLFDGNRLNDHVADNTRRTMGEMWIDGERGVLRLDGNGRLWFKTHGGPESEHRYAWQDRGFGGDCVYRTQEHILAHFIDAAPLANSGRDYLRNIEIEEAVYRSASEGVWVTVST